MTRFRIVLTWLLLAALPLQGWAAASMVHCATMGTLGQAVHAMDHAAHEHPVEHQHAHAVDAAAVADGSEAQLPGLDHACMVCAACGHAVALLPTVDVATPAAPPSVVRGALLAPLPSVAASVPDKPPRA